MPVPTPPKKPLFTVTQKPPAPKKKMRADSKKFDDEIKKLAKEIENSPGVPEKIFDTTPVERLMPKSNNLKRTPFEPPEHLSHMPFRDNDALRKLSYELKKETENKKPVKRTPRRKPAAKKTTGEK